MKIIGSSNQGNICVLTDEELLFVMFGNESHYGLTSEQKKSWNDRSMHEINLSLLFKKIRIIESYRHNDDYNSIRAQLVDMLNALTPVENFIKDTQEFVKDKING